MKVKIKVSQADIDNAKACFNSYERNATCPIAQSIRTVFKDAKVGTTDIVFSTSFNHGSFTSIASSLPGNAVEFVRRFDGKVFVEPFEFDMHVPDIVVSKEEACLLLEHTDHIEVID